MLTSSFLLPSLLHWLAIVEHAGDADEGVVGRAGDGEVGDGSGCETW